MGSDDDVCGTVRMHYTTVWSTSPRFSHSNDTRSSAGFGLSTIPKAGTSSSRYKALPYHSVSQTGTVRTLNGQQHLAGFCSPSPDTTSKVTNFHLRQPILLGACVCPRSKPAANVHLESLIFARQSCQSLERSANCHVEM